MAKILAEICQICIYIYRRIHFILSWVLLRNGLVPLPNRLCKGQASRRHIQSWFYRIHSGQQKGREFITP